MSINITVCGANKESDEYQAALKLKSIIQKTVSNSVDGEIVLFASATLFGQAVKDVDLMMIGSLFNYSETLSFYESEYENGKLINSKLVKDEVYIQDFCTTIEIKRHDISGVSVNGTDFYVKYKDGPHCVTEQSNKQKISAKCFFEQTISLSPFITNVIWFTQIGQMNIDSLLSNAGKKMPTNVIGADFGFKELMQLIILQKSPHKYKGKYIFDSDYKGCSVNKIQEALALFSKKKETMGELTRRRIELITNKSIMSNALIDTQGKVSIYRGRAGTGKTVGLIQTAIKLVDDMQARVLIITYNKALVSDIRRLFALAELPDMFEEQCVYVNTLHSYFFRLANMVLYDGKMSGDKFLNNYNSVLKEIYNYLCDEDTENIVKEIVKSDAQLDWDYVLIDEAQDWNNIERDIILRLFDKGKIIVADGGLQFVRNDEACDWSIVRERNNIKLKYCLRQKENLISFINSFSSKFGMLGAKVLSNNNMPGGKVIIISDDKLLGTHREEMNYLEQAGNIAYDMLYLVPHSLVRKNFGNSEFSRKKEFETNGIYIWDGTGNVSRDGYSIESDEVRVLQYDSARGLEGWTVFCLDFDAFLSEKEKEYVEGKADALLLESPEERKRRFLFNWAMIPLTRAIDTLVITIHDKKSNIALLLAEIAEEYPDFVFFY